MERNRSSAKAPARKASRNRWTLHKHGAPLPPERTSYTFWQLERYFLRLGTLDFDGLVALVGYMHRDIVEQRGWIAEADYQEGLALAGPLTAQLAMYQGYVHAHILGVTLVGLAFI